MKARNSGEMFLSNIEMLVSLSCHWFKSCCWSQY